MIPHRPSRLAAALALCLGLTQAVGIAATPAAPVATPVATAPATLEPGSSDAAAKHAKRTACLKEAKTKKLVGAEKNAYVKNCIAVP